MLGLAATLLLILSLALTGCRATAQPSPSPNATLTPTSTPPELLEASAIRMAALGSLSFTLIHESGATPLMTGVVMNEMTGEVLLPDKFKVRVAAEAAGITALRIDLLAADGKVHMTDPISQKWREIGFQNIPFDFTNLGEKLAEILRAIEAPTRGEYESVDGRKSLRLNGTVSSSALEKLIPNASADLVVGLEVWVREDDMLLGQARISGPVAPMDPAEVVRLLTFYAFDEPVEITPPPDV